MKQDVAEELLEKLAELEHDQWTEWSRTVTKNEPLISDDRVRRWKSLWVPYSSLADEAKEQDRIWARKTLTALIPYLPKLSQQMLRNKLENR